MAWNFKFCTSALAVVSLLGSSSLALATINTNFESSAIQDHLENQKYEQQAYKQYQKHQSVFEVNDSQNIQSYESNVPYPMNPNELQTISEDMGNANIQMKLSHLNLLNAPVLDQIASNQLNTLVHSFEGQYIDSVLLQRVLVELTRYYQKLGYTNSCAFLPEQSIINGNVDVLIATSTLEETALVNTSDVNDGYIQYLTSGVDDLKGQPVNTQVLESKLLKLTDLGMFNITGNFDSLNSTNVEQKLTLNVNKTPRLDFTAFTDNQGNEGSGKYRVGAQAIIKNFLSCADSLSFFYARTNKSQNNYAVNYEFPINSFPTVLGIDISHNNYELANEFRILGANGKSTAFELYAKQPLYRNFQTRLDAKAGYRYRQLSDSFSVFDLEFKKHTQVFFGELSGYHLFNENTFIQGSTRVALGRLYMDDEFEMMPEDNYSILNAQIKFTYKFDDVTSFQSKLDAQLSSKPLEGSEQFLAGGAQGVSSYDASELSGDGGIVFKNTVYIKPFANYEFRVGPHFDVAKVYSHSGYQESAQSLGLNLNFYYEGIFADLDLSRGLGVMPIFAENENKIFFTFGYNWSGF